jgi:hypothetical protein
MITKLSTDQEARFLQGMARSARSRDDIQIAKQPQRAPGISSLPLYTPITLHYCMLWMHGSSEAQARGHPPRSELRYPTSLGSPGPFIRRTQGKRTQEIVQRTSPEIPETYLLPTVILGTMWPTGCCLSPRPLRWGMT